MSLGTGCCGGDRRPAPTSVEAKREAALESSDLYLRRGLDLKRWWDQAYKADRFARKFPLTVSANRPDESFGFFDETTVGGRQMPIMGNFQSLLYDRPKAPTTDKVKAAQWMRDQVRQFALRYFMRVSHFTTPEAYIPPTDRPQVPSFLRPFSWCPQENPSAIGFGFQQLFYKGAADGVVRAFPETDSYQIVDLRRIGPELEWILPQVRIFNFNFTAQPFGPGTPKVAVPLDEGSYLIMNRDFVVHEEEPEPGVLGRYGFGYAFIKNPDPGLFAFGPGEFDAAIEIIQFVVLSDGSIRSEAIFVVNRPTRIVNVSLNPVDWGYNAASLLTFGTSRYLLAPFKQAADMLPGADLSFDPVSLFISTANLMTGGLAARDFCISMEQQEMNFLVQHFQQHYQTLIGSLQTWRQIPNWLAPENELPSWVVTGRA